MSARKQRGIVRFVVFTAVTLKNAVFWDVTPCESSRHPDDGDVKFLPNISSYKSHTVYKDGT
jgi:hypothetical protein